MTGMKEGTGSDPFAEDEPADQDAGTSENASPSVPDAPSDLTAEVRTEPSRPTSKNDIPYIFRRDRVTDERTLHSFYLRDLYEQVEEEARHGVQQRLGEQVPKADLREAMLLVAARDLDAVADELREWGYDME
jgi:hypothetical protein